MSNPFDNPDARYHVLVNGEGQHSLWPDFAAIPPGWQQVFGPGSRAGCLDYIDVRWTDLRPDHLVSAMGRDCGPRAATPPTDHGERA